MRHTSLYWTSRLSLLSWFWSKISAITKESYSSISSRDPELGLGAKKIFFFLFFLGPNLIVSACRPRVARSSLHSLYRVHDSIAAGSRNSCCFDASSMLHARSKRTAAPKKWDSVAARWDMLLKSRVYDTIASSAQLNWQWATFKITMYDSLVTLWPCYISMLMS